MSIDQVTVARMAAALADIADRHQPDLMSSTETLRCDWCSQQAGIPVPWPCMDRGAIGDLLPLPNNRLLMFELVATKVGALSLACPLITRLQGSH